LKVIHDLIEEPYTSPQQPNSDILSLTVSSQQNDEPSKAPLESLHPVIEKEASLIRYPSSGVICSASVPLSPPYLSTCGSKDEIEIRHQDISTSTVPSNTLSTKIEGSNATQFDVSHTPFSQLQQTQLGLESESDSHQGSVRSQSLSTVNQIVDTSSSSIPLRTFIPDTYAAAESSLLDGEESQLSARLTLSQNHPISVYTADETQDLKSKPVATVVSDTYQDDQMTLDIDISDNELADSDSGDSELSDEITRHPNQSSLRVISSPSRLPAADEGPQFEETNTLIPQTQTIFSIESNDNPRLVLDTYQDYPASSPPRDVPHIVPDTYDEIPVSLVPQNDEKPKIPVVVPNSFETNPYELSSSEDDDNNYLQYSTRKKEKTKKVSPILEDAVVNLVSDSFSSIPISGLEGTLVSGTIQKSSTLLETDDDPLPEIFEDDETRQELSPNLVLSHKSTSPLLEENLPSLKPPSTPSASSIGYSEQRKINIPPSVQQELEPYSEKDYNVESYSTQCEADKPEIGGYLYGAGIDSAVRRFTPQKASPSPQKSLALTSSPPLSTHVEKASSEKLTSMKNIDLNSDSYETQDSFPSRFTWLSNVTTPIKKVGNTNVTPTRPSPDPSTPPHRSNHQLQEDTNTNDEIASWGESVCDLIFSSSFLSPPLTSSPLLPVP
jgi:hypothetical protein